MKVGLVFGGESCEHDISIITAFSVEKLIKNRCEIIKIYLKNGRFYIGNELNNIEFFTHFSESKLKECHFSGGFLCVKSTFGVKKIKLDCALMCNHGGVGENGSLSGYFEVTGIPYTACPPFGSSLCMDKVYSKTLLEKYKFPVVCYRIYRKGYCFEKLEELDYPVILKPARLGSSVGITVAHSREELEKGLDFALQFDEKVLVERALTDFEEFNCAACEHNGKVIVSEVEKPIFKNDYLNFYDKYLNSDSANRELPAKIDGRLREKIRRITREIYTLFELKGIVRVDFLYENKKLYVNEINTIPGSLATYLFVPIGLKGADVIMYAVESAMAEYKRKEKLTRDFSSEVLKNYSGGNKFSPVKK